MTEQTANYWDRIPEHIPSTVIESYNVERCSECGGSGRCGGYIPRWSEDGQEVGGWVCRMCDGAGEIESYYEYELCELEAA